MKVKINDTWHEADMAVIEELQAIAKLCGQMEADAMKNKALYDQLKAQGKKLRNAQNMYFRFRNQANLIISKREEEAFDNLISDLTKEQQAIQAEMFR
mgnify:CR=1 FL=1